MVLPMFALDEEAHAEGGKGLQRGSAAEPWGRAAGGTFWTAYDLSVELWPVINSGVTTLVVGFIVTRDQQWCVALSAMRVSAASAWDCSNVDPDLTGEKTKTSVCSVPSAELRSCI